MKGGGCYLSCSEFCNAAAPFVNGVATRNRAPLSSCWQTTQLQGRRSPGPLKITTPPPARSRPRAARRPRARPSG